MNNFLGQELLSSLLQTLFGVLATIGAYYLKKGYELFRSRNVRNFWKPFMNDSLTVIVTEYPVSGDDRLANIAKIAGAGWLISKGMALALADLRDFCQKQVTKMKDILILGDRTGTVTTDNIIILGSPANNPYSKSYYLHLSSIFDIPFEIISNTEGTEIEIKTSSGKILSPELFEGLGHDYALIIRATYQTIPQKSIVIISGCYMWGTQAAAKAVLDPKILNEVAKETNYAENVAFIIKTRIVNLTSTGPELDINNGRYICELPYLPKRSGNKFSLSHSTIQENLLTHLV